MESPPDPASSVVLLDDTDDTDIQVVANTGKDKQLSRWPTIKSMMKTETGLILKIFHAVDECDAAKYTMASDTNNVKKNGWTRLFDNCFGGGADGRGLLAGHLSKLDKPSSMKKKVIAIWQFAVKNQDKVDKEVFTIATRQLAVHEEAKRLEKEGLDKAKNDSAIMQGQMKDYQRKMGAIPPGAKGIDGAGRIQHSTNLGLGQPASFNWANSNSNGSQDEEEEDTLLSPPNQKRNFAGGSASTSSKKKRKGSAAVNNNALEALSGLNETLTVITDKLMGSGTSAGRNSRRNSAESSELTADAEEEIAMGKLEMRKNHCIQMVNVYKDIAGCEDLFKAALTELEEVNQKILAALKK